MSRVRGFVVMEFIWFTGQIIVCGGLITVSILIETMASNGHLVHLWKLFPALPVEFVARAGRAHTAPLLEEKWNPRPNAGIA